MDLSDLVSPESVISSLRATSKKQALQELSAQAAKISGLKAGEIFDKLLEREKLGTTGVGQGIAIPHGKFAKLDKLYGLFARLEQPVNFDSIDEQPVDLIFVILAPENSGADHLKALARISRMLRNQTACEKFRGTDQPDALYALLTQSIKPHAA